MAREPFLTTTLEFFGSELVSHLAYCDWCVTQSHTVAGPSLWPGPVAVHWDLNTRSGTILTRHSQAKLAAGEKDPGHGLTLSAKLTAAGVFPKQDSSV